MAKTTKKNYKKKTGKKANVLIMKKILPKRSLDTHHFKYKRLLKNNWQLEMNGTDVPFAFAFKLDDIVNVVELKAMFDQYRINGVLYEIVPRQTEMIFQTAAGSGSPPVPNVDDGGTHLKGTSNWGHPEVLTAVDYDTITAPSSANDIMEYGTCKVTRGDRIQKRYVKPRIAVDSSIGLSLFKKWIPTNNSSVNHYGIRGCFTNIPNITINGTSDHLVISYDLVLTYYISLKMTK